MPSAVVNTVDDRLAGLQRLERLAAVPARLAASADVGEPPSLPYRHGDRLSFGTFSLGAANRVEAVARSVQDRKD